MQKDLDILIFLGENTKKLSGESRLIFLIHINNQILNCSETITPITH